eukprot:96514-Pelagomonas_calceolata.AAC.2
MALLHGAAVRGPALARGAVGCWGGEGIGGGGLRGGSAAGSHAAGAAGGTHPVHVLSDEESRKRMRRGQSGGRVQGKQTTWPQK